MATTVDARSTTRAMQGARRRHYIREGDWVDSLYKAYLTVLLTGVALFYLTVAFDGTKATPSTVTDVTHQGIGILGLAVALLVLLGLRSGSRGGPLAPDAADITYLLLAPIPRAEVLRASAFRQLRGVVLVPALAGAVAGSVASGTFGGERVEWMAAGAAFAVLTALAVWGAALVVSGTRTGARPANAIGAVLVAWAALDVALGTATSPTAQLGRVAVLPLTTSLLAGVGALGALGVVAVALAVAGGVSLEALRRRAHLLGELRFAATLQDMRSVIVVQRELAQDLPRSRPWWTVGSGRAGRAGRAESGRRGGTNRACWQRDWRGIARWPVSRFVRVVVLAAAAGVATAGVWHGTYAFVVLAGVLVYLVGIDAAEGLAQESDHAVRPQQYPVRWPDLVQSHLFAPATLLVVLGVFGLVACWLVSGSTDALAVGAIILVPVAIAGTVGAALSVVLGAPPPTLFLDIGFPEFTTLFLIIRQTIAPLVVIAAFVPAAFAYHAATQGKPAAGSAFVALLVPLVVLAAAHSYLRSRKAVHS